MAHTASSPSNDTRPTVRFLPDRVVPIREFSGPVEWAFARKVPVRPTELHRPSAGSNAPPANEVSPPRLLESEIPDTQVSEALRRLVCLHELTREMSRDDREHPLILGAVRGARERLGFDRLAVYLRDGDMVRGSVGTSQQGELVDERGYCENIQDLAEREMLEKAFHERDYSATQEGVELCIGNRVVGRGWNALVALWADDRALGWIACDNLLTGAPWSPFQLDLLKMFGAALASAIVRSREKDKLCQRNRELDARVKQKAEELSEVKAELARSEGEVESLSRVDGLTGVANRRAFEASLLAEWGRCARESAELSVVQIDVDRFGAYNERFGHAAGDLLLKQVAETLARCAKRPGDLLARCGGDEFVLLLPKTGQLGAGRFAEQCRQAIFDLEIAHPDSTELQRLTISVGVATACPPRGSAQACLQAAESGLFDAKRRNGNRVVHHRE